MEEEQPLGQRGHAPEPEVGPLDVDELVAERHLLLIHGQRAEATRRHQHHRTEQTGDHRRLDVLGPVNARDAPKADATRKPAGHRLDRVRGEDGPGDHVACLPPSAEREPGGDSKPEAPGAQQPRRQPVGRRHGDRGFIGLDASGVRRWLCDARRRGDDRDAGTNGCRSQHGQRHRRRPECRDEKLGGRTPPEQRPRRRRQPRDRAAERPDDRHEQGAVDRGAGEVRQHQRSFRWPAPSLVTMASSSRSSASETRPGSER